MINKSVVPTAPPDPPRMWRYVSWTGQWLYVWWDHIQYDWFGNISFPLYYKVSVEVCTSILPENTVLHEMKRNDDNVPHLFFSRSCSERLATFTARSTSLAGTSWTSPCLRSETMS